MNHKTVLAGGIKLAIVYIVQPKCELLELLVELIANFWKKQNRNKILCHWHVVRQNYHIFYLSKCCLNLRQNIICSLQIKTLKTFINCRGLKLVYHNAGIIWSKPHGSSCCIVVKSTSFDDISSCYTWFSSIKLA